jgi:L-lactate utilization protein LutC
MNRDAFLQRIRDAVKAGNRPGAAPELPARGNTGYQGCGGDRVAAFCEAFCGAGGQPYLVNDAAAAVQRVLQIVQEKGARKVLLGQGAFIDSLDLSAPLNKAGVDISTRSREALFAADLGITGADFLVAETGSIIVLTRPEEPRSLSLLPPVHIVVATPASIVPDLFDVFAAVGAEPNQIPTLPSCISVITGPSKTGDIELKLVTGVHGPGEVHVVLVAPPQPE